MVYFIFILFFVLFFFFSLPRTVALPKVAFERLACGLGLKAIGGSALFNAFIFYDSFYFIFIWFYTRLNRSGFLDELLVYEAIEARF